MLQNKINTYIIHFTIGDGNGYAIVNAHTPIQARQIFHTQTATVSPRVSTIKELKYFGEEMQLVYEGSIVTGGKSLYDLAVLKGFKGTLEDFIESQKGAPGEKGDKGDPGEKGETGSTGPEGKQGPKGDTFTYADMTTAEKEDLVSHIDLSGKQDTLVSGESIKTINGTSVLGSGDITTPNTTYDAMTSQELSTGTSTDGKLVTPKLLHDELGNKTDISTLANYCPIIEDTRSSEVAAITGNAPFASLVSGQRIMLHFSEKATNDATLELTLSDGVTTTGAKYLKYQRRDNTLSKLQTSYGLYLVGQYIEMVYNGTDWICISPVDTSATYNAMTQAQVDAGTDTTGKTITAKLLCDNFAKIVTVESVSSASTISLTCQPNKFYKIGAVEDLTLDFNFDGTIAYAYGGKFEASSNGITVTLASGYSLADGSATPSAGNVYEFTMVDYKVKISKV